MLLFEGIIDKITVCKKLPKKFLKNYQKICKLAIFKISLLPWQRGFLTTFFIKSKLLRATLNKVELSFTNTYSKTQNMGLAFNLWLIVLNEFKQQASEVHIL
jgi:hypothetical protein